MPIQLPILLQWPDCASFTSYYPAENLAVVQYLQTWLGDAIREDACVCVYGAAGIGLTHLLQACCQSLQLQGQAAAYLPMKQNLSLAIVEGMETLALVAVDDVDQIAGDRDWEEAIFHCYNRCKIKATPFLLASHTPPQQIAWSLPDLASRINASILIPVQPLADEAKIAALQHRAKLRGLDLPLEVGNYLLNHLPRDTKALFQVLETLDQAAYIAQRRLTIPFVKEVLVKAQGAHNL